MRIIINIDAVNDPERYGKKAVRVRTGYTFNSNDKLAVQNCGVEIYNIIKDGFGRGF